VLLLLGGVAAHSWLECVDYPAEVTRTRGYDKTLCRAFARSWSNRGAQASTPGRDTLPAQFNRPLDNNGRVCFTSINDPSNYSPKYPRATYRLGQKVRLIWPSKNHGGPSDGSCRETSRDRGMELHVKCGGPEITFDEVVNGKRWLALNMKQSGWQTQKWGKGWSDGKGFKQCLNFCANTDLSMCWGDFIVPDGLPENQVCTFYWYWNSGRPYTICWEAMILASQSNDIPVPLIQPPSPTTRAPKSQNVPTSSPVNQVPSSPAVGITNLVLWAASPAATVRELKSQDAICLQDFPGGFNIEAVISGSLPHGSVVRFSYGNTPSRIEAKAPYFAGGDSSGAPNAWETALGSGSLSAQVFTSSSLSSEIGKEFRIELTIADGTCSEGLPIS